MNFGVGDTGLLTGTRTLSEELKFLREFMTNCLKDWYHYVDARRAQYYELNYFTTEQLVVLRKCLAEFTWEKKQQSPGHESSIPHDLPAQVYALLTSVKDLCKRTDVEVAVKCAAKDFNMKKMDDAEQAEARKKAEKFESAKKVVEELDEEYAIDSKTAWASIMALGHEGVTITDYMNWSVNNAANEDLIAELTGSLKLAGEDEADSSDDDDDLLLPTHTKTFRQVASDLLEEVVRDR